MTGRMRDGHIAVIDIGKTNAKLALVRMPDLTEVAVLTRPNMVIAGPPYPHFDVEGHWEFILGGLARFHAEFGIAAITVTTHGAACALLDRDGRLAAPILDYEHTGPESLAAAYDAIRPPFSDTGSPRLSMGLNLGAQLHWQFASDPALLGKVRHIVTYPQFWGYRLTGELATDVTSLGCHTDLWNPYEGRFSSLTDALGITDKIAPPRRPADVLGPITTEVAQRTRLPSDTPVYCGIHDSNASLLSHLVSREPPYSVVSTGTWVIAMAIGGRQTALDPAMDTLVNVNAFGQPVPSARFMGGREHDLALAGASAEASDGDIAAVLSRQMMLMPSLAPQTGPFAGSSAHWIGHEPALDSGERTAAVGFYLAMVTARCLELVGHEGPVIVEGPFARNRPYLWMLQTASSSPVIPMGSATGTSQGAALLVEGTAIRTQSEPLPQLEDNRVVAAMADYAKAWRSAAATGRG